MKFLSLPVAGLMRIFLYIILVIACVTASRVNAEDFIPRHTGDYGNVTVMEASGNFDSNNPDGSVNASPRQAIAKEFFRTHKDEYDFVTIFTNFDYQLPPKAIAYYSGVKNDIEGIGAKQFDHSSYYGSAGKLQGTIDMWNLLKLATNPLDPKFTFTVDTLVHETLHRWGAFVRFKDWNGTESPALLGYQDYHWSFLFDSGGSTHYGNKWRDNGDGTFTSIAVRKYYSPLDLYLMGMIDKSKVPPTLLIDNPDIDRERDSELGATVSGTPRYVTVDDIIAVEGERVPAAGGSPKSFKMAFIYVTRPGTFKADDLVGMENLRNAFLTRFSILTDGKGLVQVASALKEDLAVNPGVQPSGSTTRASSPNIDAGVTWLVNNQQADGSWTDFVLTHERDTAEAVGTLQIFPAALSQFQSGLAWLGQSAPANTDYLARRVETVAHAGGDTTALVQELLSRVGLDGGWGSGRSYSSNATDTALALKALALAGHRDQAVTSRAIAYLQAAQNCDGGWSGSDTNSTIQPTAAVLTAFNAYRNSYALEENLAKGVLFLAGKQNPDGGFGNSPSTVYDTALASMALSTVGADRALVTKGNDFLLGQQYEDGSWDESPFQTALAVRSIYKGSMDPDLSLKADDISLIPEKVTELPTVAVVSAVIRNLGRTDVPQAKVAIYDGAVAPDKKVGEQTVAFPGSSPVTVTFSVPVTDGNGHYFYLVVDPDNVVKESNKNNNSAAKSLLPEATYDFEVLAADVTASPNPVDMYQEARISAKISNRGTMTAYNVPVRFFIDQADVPLDIATVTVDIPAGGTAVKEIAWKTNRSGVNLPLTVQVDPSQSFTETSSANNRAAVPLTVNAPAMTDPNLALSYQDVVISPNPVHERESTTVSATVRNDGYADAANIEVDFYKGVPGAGGTLLATRTIASLKPTESVIVSVEWNNIMEAGEKIIFVKVDPRNLITEQSEDDNDAFAKLNVSSLADLAVSANSIAFTPHGPRDGEPVTIGVTVQNKGDLGATNVSVKTYEGSVLLNSQVIAAVAGHSQATVTFTYDTSGRSGMHQITVAVEADSAVLEQSKDNNSAVGAFGVFRSDLMLSEPYFSPNGDGVKDSTQFSFRFDVPQSVKIVVVNSKGETVRSFSGSEFANATAGSIIWDGFDSEGKVVDDGEYRIKLVDANGVTLSDVAVVVDNNRSSLAEALLSGNVLSNDLTCKMPANIFNGGYSSDYYDLDQNQIWLPDGSGTVYYTGYYQVEGSMEHAGLFKLSVDGSTLDKLTTREWLIDGRRAILDFVPSPDGSKIAIVASQATPIGVNSNSYKYELWVMNNDGSNLRLFDSLNFGDYYTVTKRYKIQTKDDFYYNYDPHVIAWNPDGRTVAYPVFWWNGPAGAVRGDYGKEVISMNTETGLRTTLATMSFSNSQVLYFPGRNPSLDGFTSRHLWKESVWSPDGEKIFVSEWVRGTYSPYSNLFAAIVDKGGNLIKTTPPNALPAALWVDNMTVMVNPAPGASWIPSSYISANPDIPDTIEYGVGQTLHSPDKKLTAFVKSGNIEIPDWC